MCSKRSYWRFSKFMWSRNWYREFQAGDHPLNLKIRELARETSNKSILYSLCFLWHSWFRFRQVSENRQIYSAVFLRISASSVDMPRMLNVAKVLVLNIALRTRGVEMVIRCCFLASEKTILGFIILKIHIAHNHRISRTFPHGNKK